MINQESFMKMASTIRDLTERVQRLEGMEEAAGVDPAGHKHSELWASDGDPQAVSADADGNVTISNTTTVQKIKSSVSNNLRIEFHETGVIGGSSAVEHDIVDAIRARGILLVYSSLGSAVSGQFVCNRGSVVALGLAPSMTNTKDNANTVNIYYGSDEYVKLQNKHPSPGTFQFMFITHGQSALDTSL